ncbi:hypothetical protein L6164_021414 [Bauhinia variegata]|uniref:Uncharacterized protein n=1 Tax=Bauhinia variegata TaxID=167791 RepID=A0ACB9MYF7_BAUVA|nr:hypothetical protein L6164_021414 [Bauhinia variegata]
MVLAQVGEKISYALQPMRNSTVVDEDVLNKCIDRIIRGLTFADFSFQLLINMENSITKAVVDCPVGHDKRIAIEQAVFNELCQMLDSGKPSFTPVKGKTSVVMLVGLQDTFKAGALDQLKQNAQKAEIPFFGRCLEPSAASSLLMRK